MLLPEFFRFCGDHPVLVLWDDVGLIAELGSFDLGALSS